MYATDFKQVGANIERAMTNRGISSQALADSLGITEKSVRAIIKGGKAVNMTELSLIGTALNCSADELLTVDTTLTPEKPIFDVMNAVTDPQAKEKVALLRTAINQIHLLEELVVEE